MQGDQRNRGKQMKFAKILLLAMLPMAAASAARADVVRHPIPNSTFPIAQAVQVTGNATTYYVSGQVPPVANKDADPASRVRPMATPRRRPSACSTRSRPFWKALVFRMGDVVKMQVFLVHNAAAPMDFKAFMEGYTQFFGGSQPNLPARSVVGVAALANPGFLVEIEVIAVKDAK